ncbi:acyl-CoA thioesterase [Metabacillus arenae]|uniref:Acyl-CoA thioesterase n=1 Tax=Metabacillus arenae TaxID=2771434 RepID=A0A926NJL9_9BACI|nr:acyl-CoA thioesterase [Metabacillus arenae]MBD1382929.1 acyl-CoA thioesterase [Metabacillus arenae]
MLETVTKIDVMEKDIDGLDHVNNSIYVSYFGIARKEWYREAGLSFEEKQKRNIGTVIRKLEINFLKESRLGDSLKIITRPLQLGNKSFLLKQNIYNQNDEHLTDITVTVVMFDTINRKSIKVVEEIARHFK